jgi:hypothetical protein
VKSRVFEEHPALLFWTRTEDSSIIPSEIQHARLRIRLTLRRGVLSIGTRGWDEKNMRVFDSVLGRK